MHPFLAKLFESGKACTAAQIDRTYEDLHMKDYRPAEPLAGGHGSVQNRAREQPVLCKRLKPL